MIIHNDQFLQQVMSDSKVSIEETSELAIRNECFTTTHKQQMNLQQATSHE